MSDEDTLRRQSSEHLAMLWSARDQIASDRRCEHRRGRCLLTSAVLRDCECMQSAARRLAAEDLAP